MHLVHDLLVVVVADGATQLVVVHVWLAFAHSPHGGDGLGVQEFELSLAAHPRDDVGVGGVLEQLVEELP